MISLGDIAEVRIGHSFRDGVTPDAEGNVVVLQSKDLADATSETAGDPVRVALDRFDAALLVLPGDVVFLARGTRYPAVAVPEMLDGALVAAPLYLIRPDQARADARYLAAIIAAPAIQAKLKAEAKGSYIPQVPADAIRALEIPLPPLPEQRAIAALADLARQEARLAAALAAHRSVWLHALAVQKDGAGSERNSRGHANAPG